MSDVISALLNLLLQAAWLLAVLTARFAVFVGVVIWTYTPVLLQHLWSLTRWLLKQSSIFLGYVYRGLVFCAYWMRVGLLAVAGWTLRVLSLILTQQLPILAQHLFKGSFWTGKQSVKLSELTLKGAWRGILFALQATWTISKAIAKSVTVIVNTLLHLSIAVFKMIRGRVIKQNRVTPEKSPVITTAAALPEPVLVHTKIEKSLPPTRSSRWFSKASAAGILVSLAILGVFIFPDLFYRLIPFKSEPILSAVDDSTLGGKFEDGTRTVEMEIPERDENLPEGNWLIIQKIGVRTLVNEAPEEEYEDVLRKGVWREPSFATPFLTPEYPMILMAHRFGYISWSNQFRRENSFYNLEKLEIGDTFEVIWDKRRFVYEIYAGEEAKELTDYEAHVVLYTCKYLNSPLRIFRYARQVDFENPTVVSSE